MSLIDDIKRDREAGTPGPWQAVEWQHYFSVRGSTGVISRGSCTPGGSYGAQGRSDANRTARVPDMEAALLAAEALAGMLENCLEVLTKADDRLCCDGRECGCYGATKHQEAEHYANAALAAYRQATGETA